MRLGKEAKSRAKIIKGKTRKNVGKATGSNRLEARGKIGELIGKLRLRGERARGRVRH
jgi:uncharacterized protein YjbJ (UPF0337 family)